MSQDHPDPTSAGELERRRAARDEVLLDAIASGVTYLEAAALAGCSPRTVRRVAAGGAFAAELARRRAAHVAELTGRLSSLADRALTAIAGCLEADRDADRLKAAIAVLTLAERFRASHDIDLRLDEQERQVDDLLARRVADIAGIDDRTPVVEKGDEDEL